MIHCRVLQVSTRKLILSGFVLFGLVSCNAQASQCKQFADITQQSQSIRESFDSEIEAVQLRASGAQDLEQLKAAAKEYTGAVRQVTDQLDSMTQSFEGITLTDEQLDEYRDRYIEFLKETKTALGIASGVMQQVIDTKTEAEFRDSFGTLTAQGDRAFKDLQSLDTEEDDILGQFNAYCAGEVGKI